MSRNKGIIHIVTTILWLIASTSSTTTAQVQIAPSAIFLSDNHTTDRLIIRNSSNKPQEINIDLIFGYPTTDEQGNVYLKTFDEIPNGAPAAVEWVRVYPRHLILPPNQQQVVRFSARPPVELQPGEYWARPAISFSDVQKEVSTDKHRVSTRINFVQRTLLSLNYRHGKVHTYLTITDISVESTDGQLYLLADLERKGNAAYLGEVRVSIYSNNEEVKYYQRDIAIYHSQKRKFSIDISDLPHGIYSALLSFTTERRAAKQNSILTFPPITKEVVFTIK